MIHYGQVTKASIIYILDIKKILKDYFRNITSVDKINEKNILYT